jgi:acetyl/propionyl-CoA carboxylase alpha subunit
MNTRLQVEHPITEAVTGLDLVQWQFRIAGGDRVTIDPGSRSRRAVTPSRRASTRRIRTRVHALAGPHPAPADASGPGVRDDGGYDALDEVPIFYDSLVSKLIAWGETRDAAIARLRRAIGE